MTNNHPENHPGNNPGPPEDDPFFKAAVQEYNPAYWNTARHHDRDIEESMMLAPVGNEEDEPDMFNDMDVEKDSGMGAMQRRGIRKNTMKSDDDDDEDDNQDQDIFEAEEELYEDLDEDLLDEDEDLDEDLYEDDDMEDDENVEDY
jgi:hypothetical protein